MVNATSATMPAGVMAASRRPAPPPIAIVGCPLAKFTTPKSRTPLPDLLGYLEPRLSLAASKARMHWSPAGTSKHVAKRLQSHCDGLLKCDEEEVWGSWPRFGGQP